MTMQGLDNIVPVLYYFSACKCNNAKFSFVCSDGRVSFYAFLEDTIFQPSSKNHTESNSNTIPSDANVKSNAVLSASVVGNLVTNLKNNVIIAFELNQVKVL